MEKTARPTRQELLRKRGVDVDAIRTEQEKAERGCVVRSLESALSALADEPIRATAQEWELWLAVVRQDQPFDFSYFDAGLISKPVGEAVKNSLRAKVERDRSMIINLIRQLSAHSTPIGRILSAAETAPAILDQDKIMAEINQGNQVIAIGAVRSADGPSMHAQHLGYDHDRRQLVSLSDGGTAVKLAADKLFTLVLKKKSSDHR